MLKICYFPFNSEGKGSKEDLGRKRSTGRGSWRGGREGDGMVGEGKGRVEVGRGKRKRW
jgi:hypothetical protein